MNPFETETMAELQLRQGHRDEALAIYRRLRERTAEAVARTRIEERMRSIEREMPGAAKAIPTPASPPSTPLPPPLSLPGVRARRSGDQLIVEWRLPSKTPSPTLELLLVTTGDAGVATERRAIDLKDDAGQLELKIRGLHSARAAAGTRGSGSFVPLVRGASPSP